MSLSTHSFSFGLISGSGVSPSWPTVTTLAEMLSYEDSEWTAQTATKLTLPDAITFSGDSNVAGTTAGVTIPMTTALATWFNGTANNVAVGNTASHNILNTFAALSAGQKNDYGYTAGGGNNWPSESGVYLAIGAGGSGGTDGTYALAFSGGTTSGTPITPTGTFTVSGGAVTALTVTNRGGGYTAAPTVSLSACPGLTGASVTVTLNSVQSVKDDMDDLLAMAGSTRILGAPGRSSTVTSYIWAKGVLVEGYQRATHGARAVSHVDLIRLHSNGTTDNTAVLAGDTPPSLRVDGTHYNDAANTHLARKFGWMMAAQAAVAGPWVHDQTVAAKNGAAAGTVIANMLYLGSPVTWAIVGGNTSGAFAINASTGQITRSASGTVPDLTELFVCATDSAGRLSNAARIIVGRALDGTTPNAGVRLAGNGQNTLAVHAFDGVANSKKLTFIIHMRMNSDQTGGDVLTGLFGTSFSQYVQRVSSYRLRWTPRGVGNNNAYSAGLFSPTPSDTTAWNTYFFSLDTTSGNQFSRGAVNEQNSTATTPTADVLVDLTTQFRLLSGATLAGDDVKFVWAAADYMNVNDSAVRALFYDSATKTPNDLGASGTVSGVTPFLYMRGREGDWLTGSNYGTGGNVMLPTLIDPALRGFTAV